MQCSLVDLSKVFSSSKNLPEPDFSFFKDGVNFSVYKVKDFFSQDYLNDSLKNILLEARKSFWIYGDVPTFDSNDQYSSIYLVRSCYKSIKDNISFATEEWLSLRLINNSISNNRIADLDACYLNDVPLRNFLDKGKNVSQVTISRLCGIKPYVRSGDRFSFLESTDNGNFYTGISFVLMLFFFLKQNSSKFSEIKYGNMLLQDKFFRKVFLPIFNKDLESIFPLSNNFFGYEKKSFKVDRHFLKKQSYRFFGYWLNLDQLFDLFFDLKNKKIVDEKFFLNYITGTVDSFDDFYINNKGKYHKVLHNINNLGNLLTKDGNIDDSNFSGNDLRKHIDDFVGDGPDLRLIDFSNFLKKTQELFNLKLL